MLSNQICARFLPCHLAQIYLPSQTLIKLAQEWALRLLVFCKLWPISSNVTHIFGCQGPKANCRSTFSRFNAIKSNLCTPVAMPFGPNLSSPSNPYKTGARAGFALARFPQVVANLWEL